MKTGCLENADLDWTQTSKTKTSYFQLVVDVVARDSYGIEI